MIRADGGTGDFKTVTLSTSAYSALYAGKADFAMPMPTWEGLEAKLLGKPLKDFQLSDYGFPATYSTLIASSGQYLKQHPAVARKFLAAVSKGYAYAAKNPDKASALLIKANRSVLTNTELVKQSERLLAKEYYLAADGSVGGQSAKRWQDYTHFQFKAGLLSDANGKKLTKEPDASAFFTTTYLPEQ